MGTWRLSLNGPGRISTALANMAAITPIQRSVPGMRLAAIKETARNAAVPSTVRSLIRHEVMPYFRPIIPEAASPIRKITREKDAIRAGKASKSKKEAIRTQVEPLIAGEVFELGISFGRINLPNRPCINVEMTVKRALARSRDKAVIAATARISRVGTLLK